MVRFEILRARANSRSVNSLTSSMRAHLGTLTSSMTNAWGKMGDNARGIAGHDADLVVVTSNGKHERTYSCQLYLLRLNGSTLKASIVGLGDYINEIGADVGRLAKTLERFAAVKYLSCNAARG